MLRLGVVAGADVLELGARDQVAGAAGRWGSRRAGRFAPRPSTWVLTTTSTSSASTPGVPQGREARAEAGGVVEGEERVDHARPPTAVRTTMADEPTRSAQSVGDEVRAASHGRRCSAAVVRLVLGQDELEPGVVDPGDLDRTARSSCRMAAHAYDRAPASRPIGFEPCAAASSPPPRPTRSRPTSAPRPPRRCSSRRTTWRPPSDVYAVLSDGSTRHVDAFHWGLVPLWAKDAKIGSQDDQRPGRDPGRRRTPTSRRSRSGAASSPPTASTSGRRTPPSPRRARSSRSSSTGPTASPTRSPGCGRCGGARTRTRSRCGPARSSPPRPTRRWPRSTTGCR